MSSIPLTSPDQPNGTQSLLIGETNTALAVSRGSFQSTSAHFDAILELADGATYSGISFGARDKSISGECVFQTGTWMYTHTVASILPNRKNRHGRVYGILDRSIV